MTTCRSCHGTLDPFLDLGRLQLTGYLTPEEEARPSWPLTLAACADCRLVQLTDTAPRGELFTQYWYRSGVNEVMRRELHDIVDTTCAFVRLTPDDIVMDIGANDGTLLAHYLEAMGGRVFRIACEPAENLAAPLRGHADVVFHAFFPDCYPELHHLEGRIKIITSIAMFYAVDDLPKFLAAISRLLHPAGVWIVQFQDLAGMIRATAFDNICHEHLTYWSLETFSAMLKPYGLVVTDAEVRAINGGSYRLTVQQAGNPVNPRVRELLGRERGCQEWGVLERFAWQVQDRRRQIRAAVEVRKELGYEVDLYGASTKANTLLQVCGLTDATIRCAWERSPEKWGLRTAGSNIPIVSEEDGRSDAPAALLLGIWQFREAVLQREVAFLEAGGTIIAPLPTVDIITASKVVHVHA